MAWLAQRMANIVHPTDNHTPTVRLNANVGPTLSCYLGKNNNIEVLRCLVTQSLKNASNIETQGLVTVLHISGQTMLKRKSKKNIKLYHVGSIVMHQSWPARPMIDKVSFPFCTQ